jgi:hypothetical protein
MIGDTPAGRMDGSTKAVQRPSRPAPAFRRVGIASDTGRVPPNRTQHAYDVKWEFTICLPERQRPDNWISSLPIISARATPRPHLLQEPAHPALTSLGSASDLPAMAGETRRAEVYPLGLYPAGSSPRHAPFHLSRTVPSAPGVTFIEALTEILRASPAMSRRLRLD